MLSEPASGPDESPNSVSLFLISTNISGEDHSFLKPFFHPYP